MVLKVVVEGVPQDVMAVSEEIVMKRYMFAWCLDRADISSQSGKVDMSNLDSLAYKT